MKRLVKYKSLYVSKKTEYDTEYDKKKICIKEKHE